MALPELIPLEEFDESGNLPELVPLDRFDERGALIQTQPTRQNRVQQAAAASRHLDVPALSYRGGPRPPAPDMNQMGRNLANLYPEGPARSAALQQYGLPESGGFASDITASLFGEMPTMTAALMGGALGAASPIPGGAFIGATAGAGLGSLYRQLAGLQATDDLTGQNVMQQALPAAAQDAAWEAGGLGLASGIGRLGQRIRQAFRTPGPTSRELSPEAQAQMARVRAAGGLDTDVPPTQLPVPARGLRGTIDMPEAAFQRAAQNYSLASQLERRTGIPYGQTPGELMDDPRIMDRERTAILRGGVAPDTGEAFSARFLDMLNQRAASAENLMGQFVRSIPPPGQTVSTQRGFSALPRAARDVVDALYKRRSDEMAPLYAAALESAPRINATTLERGIREAAGRNAGRTRDVLRDAADELKAEMAEDGTVSANFLHNLQSDRSSAARHIGTQRKAGQQLVDEVVKPAKQLLDDTVPDYAGVTAEYARRSKAVEDFQEKSALGALSGTKPKAAALRKAGRALVAPDTTPGEIRKLRKDLRVAMRELHPDPDVAEQEYKDLWQGYKAAFVQNKLSQIRATGTRRGANVPQQVGKLFGSTEDAAGGRATQEQLKAMFTRKEYARLQLIQQAFRRTADLFSYGSATAPRLEEGASPLVQAGTEAVATGGAGGPGVAGAWNTLTRAMVGPAQRWLRGGQAVEDAHAQAILSGLDASMDHLRQLNRDLQELRLADPVTVEDAAVRLWGTVLGGTGAAAAQE